MNNWFNKLSTHYKIAQDKMKYFILFFYPNFELILNNLTRFGSNISFNLKLINHIEIKKEIRQILVSDSYVCLYTIKFLFYLDSIGKKYLNPTG